VSNGFEHLEENEKESEESIFDRKAIRREKEYSVTKASKSKKKEFRKEFRY
jgi:hypothetical protein